MPTHLYFSIPIPQRHQPQSVRASLYDSKSRKRKRVTDEDSSASSDDDHSQKLNDQSSANRRPEKPRTNLGRFETRLSQDELEQYRVAGYTDAEEALPPQFPHRPLLDAPPDGGTGRGLPAVIALEDRLAELSPPCLVPYRILEQGSSASKHQPGTSVRRHHLSVLTTILHRCLLTEDYDRAGRAWGMLIQTKMRGKALDIRNEGIWGIGAEVLLRRGQQPPRNATEQMEGQEPNSPIHITRHAFLKAKEYYDRLILQYPYHKSKTTRVSSLDFYPAMFGLWIYVAQQAHHSEPRPRQTEESRDNIALPTTEEEDTCTNGRLRKSRRAEMHEADLIAKRIDELMFSPPYVDSPELWHIRGMVALWAADLCLDLSSLARDDGDDDEEEEEDVDGLDTAQDFMAKRTADLDRASAAFQKVVTLGGDVWDGVRHLLPEMNSDEDGD